MLIKIENGAAVGAPILEDNFRYLFPDVVFPLVLTNAIVEPYGYGMYDFSPVPEHGPYQKLVEARPIPDANGIWRQQWQITEPTAQELADLKAAWRARKWEDIKRLRDTKTQRGGFPVGQHWFHSDTFSRTQQIGLTIMGASMPSNLMWKTMSGVFVAMTPTLAQQIFASAGAQDAALFGHAEALHQQLQQSNDPANFDITLGWPATYNGI